MRFIPLFLVFSLLLTGCRFPDAFLQKMTAFGQVTAYEDMEYTRPDMDALHSALDTSCELAQTADSVDTLMDAVYAFYDEYDSFYTNYTLADIHYCADLSSAFWEREYTFCTEQEPAVEAALEELFCELAVCDLKDALEADEFWGEGFFDDYTAEPTIDQTLLALMEQEAELEGSYYALSDRYAEADYTLDDALYQDIADLFIRLIQVRQEMADYLGYPDYPTLAYDMYYWRDYTPGQATEYLTKLGNALHDPYVALADSSVWEDTYTYCSEQETFRYVRSSTKAMGGIVADAFAYLDKYGLHDILYRENKLDSSFETYIWNYYAPFVFMNPYLNQTDKLVFSHEFGHFAADYSCDGTLAGTDIAEIHSQAMEYLTLCYGKDTEALTRYKLADSLCTYMEQSAYALFEHQVYQLRGDALTEENITALFRDVGQQFGFDAWDWDPREYTIILHFFTDPMYIISYVVSNDLAMQLYQLELEDPGAGLALYEQILPSQESYIVTFAQDCGLESPFSQARLQALTAFYQNITF